MNKILKLEIIGFVVCSVLGTLLHFLYDWTGQNSIIGLFVPVNESPFEHLKLLFFPFVLFGIYESIKLAKDKFNVFSAKLAGIVCGMVTTLAIYYLSLGITGKMINVINIGSFFVGLAVAFFVSYKIMKASVGNGICNTGSAIVLIIMAVMFMFFTYFPIEIPLFQDPQNHTYGIKK